jgi:hypothetical protein
MKRLALAAFAVVACAAIAYAQTVVGPTQDSATIGAYNSVAPTCTSGNLCRVQTDINGQLKTVAGAAAPSSSSSIGITPVVSASAEATHVLKATPGNLYSVYATNLTSTAGFLVVLNATSAPADGAITPLVCVPLPSNGNATLNFNPGPPEVYSTGITAVITSAATCFTKTTGVITGFISGSVQ